MEIKTKKELTFYLLADRLMNMKSSKRSIDDRIKEFFVPDYVMTYLESMRKTSYYKHRLSKGGVFFYLLYLYYYRKYRKLGVKLNFSIGYNCFGYGLVLPHYGTIVVGDSNRIGKYAVIHTSTCITDTAKTIGNGLYLSTGSIITGAQVLGNNISIGANSLVNKNYSEDNSLLVGSPAEKRKETVAWYINGSHRDAVEYLEKKKIEYGIDY